MYPDIPTTTWGATWGCHAMGPPRGAMGKAGKSHHFISLMSPQLKVSAVKRVFVLFVEVHSRYPPKKLTAEAPEKY